MQEKPFLIEIRQDRPRPNGRFVPAASLKIMEELRTSGLLHDLPAEDLKSLVYLLTFLSPEGNCTVSLPILTSAMRASSHQVKERMHRLAEFRFQEMHIITEIKHESGLYTYSLHPRLVAYEHLTTSEPHSTSPIVTGSRDRVIANTRTYYATPRAEAERIIAGQLGHAIPETDIPEHDTPETDEQRKLRVRLENVGLTTDQATEVLSTYAADVIAQQLDWLPYRKAKNPAGYLLAAIDGGYKEPRALRDRRFVLEEKCEGESSVDEEVVPDDAPDQDGAPDQDDVPVQNDTPDHGLQLEVDGPPLSLPPKE